MKTFAVYASVSLLNAPAWLGAFREKYDEPWEPHITLKQPCFVDEAQIGAIKKIVGDLFSKSAESSNGLHLMFDMIVEHTDADGMTCIMIRTNSPECHALQQRIVDALGDYRRYTEPELATYEKNFLPHITIGRNLDAAMLACARRDLPDDVRCEGMMANVTLSIAPDGLSPEATIATQEQIIFPLVVTKE